MKKANKKGSVLSAPNSRIVGSAVVDPKTLKRHPMNARTHPEIQRKIVAAAIARIGWVDEVKVSKKTGYIVDGHLRADVAESRGELVPVTYLDLTPDQERELLATYDPIGDLAVVDEEQLASLLAEVELGDADLTALLEGLLGDAHQETLQDVAGPGVPRDTPKVKVVGDMGSPKAQIKPVLYAAQVHTFEAALRETGEANRGRALMEICQFYIDANKTED